MVRTKFADLATGYERVVHGGRGSYVEMTHEQINREALRSPSKRRQQIEQQFPDGIFYREWRTVPDGIKVYEQLRYVGYADYNPGMFYVAVEDVSRWTTTEKHVTVARCRKHPETIYLFGDNTKHFGKIGQALIRDEPNAMGIPVKLRPAMDRDAFFSDEDYERNVERITDAVVDVERRAIGKKVVVPVGLGSGRAQLPMRAPETYAFLCKILGMDNLFA
jgi:hypothetical protein